MNKAALAFTRNDAKAAYERGEFARALAMFEQLSKAGDVYCLVVAARMYLDGTGTGVDINKADVLLDRAINLGSIEAVLQKAVVFRDRGNEDEYFRHVKRAADMGLLPAKYYLAVAYWHGIGTKLDQGLAKQVMAEAARDQHVFARAWLARKAMKNPFHLLRFGRGLISFLSATCRGIYLSFANPDDERIR